jgi:hypothetical protein
MNLNYKFDAIQKRFIKSYQEYLRGKKFNKKIKSRLLNYTKVNLIFIKGIFLNKKNMVFNKKEYFNDRKKKINFIFKFLGDLPLPVKKIYGPGNIEINFFLRTVKKIIFYLLEKKIQKIRLIKVEENQEEFLKNISKSRKKIKQYLKYIPESLFSELIKINFLKKKQLQTSVWQLITNYRLSNLLISEKKINFLNIIHGGGFLEWKKSNIEILDYALYNTKLKKISISDLRIIKEQDFKNFIYVCRTPIDDFDKFLCYGLRNHLKEKINIKNLKYIINKFDIKFRKHPKNYNKVYKKISKQFKTTNKIKRGSIFIFDTLSSTLTYWLIANNIPFIYLLNSLRKSELTEKKLQYVNYMEKKGVLLISNSLHEINIFLEKFRRDFSLRNICIYNRKLLGVGSKI